MNGKLEALFYQTGAGNEPVREWLLSIPKTERKSVGEDIAYVQYKWPVGKPRVDHLRGPVREVRTVWRIRLRARCSRSTKTG